MIIKMQSQTDWVVMNMVKAHIAKLVEGNHNGEYDDDIRRNKAALRSFFDDVWERSDD